MADDSDRLHRLVRYGTELVDESAGQRIRLVALASVVVCLGLFMATGFVPLALLVPILPAAMILFTARPRTPMPTGRATDAGWTMGHPWVEVDDERYFVSEDEMVERVGDRYLQMLAEPAATPDHAGFRIDVQPSVPFLPEPEWIASMTRDTVIRGIFLTLMGAAWGSVLWGLGVDLLNDPAGPTLMGAAVGAVVSGFTSALGAAVGTTCMSVMYAIEIAILQQILHAVFLRVAGGGRPTEVVLRGRVLSVGSGASEQRFHLDEPGRLLTLVTEGSDGVLTLRNERERVEIRGRTGQLAWIRDVIERRPVDQAGRDAVPESLRAMAARRVGETG